MKTSQIKYIFVMAMSLIIASCTDEEKITLNPDAAVVASASSSTVVLSEDNEGSDALTVSWPQPEYGFEASPTYVLYLYNDTGDSLAVSNGGALTKTFKTEELNRVLTTLKFTPGTAAPLKIKVQSQLTPNRSVMSDLLTVTATAYSSFLDLSTTWGIVGSGYNNWGDFPDAPFYTTSTANVLVAYVTLLDGEIKFRENNDWTNNFGDDGADGTLEPGAANIAVTAGTYKILFNPTAKTYSMEKYSWGIVGSAYNDWGATPDANFTYDPATDQWRALVVLKDGEFKIRKNNDWGTNYGDDGADGKLDDGGANIAATAGKYEITFNEKDLTITVKPIDHIWGLVGSAYNDWGATPDAMFVRDYTADDVWVLKSVKLLDGEFKIRDSNDWGLNYGDDGADGKLEANGANIAATAGYYNITLDFSNPDAPTIQIQKL